MKQKRRLKIMLRNWEFALKAIVVCGSIAGLALASMYILFLGMFSLHLGKHEPDGACLVEAWQWDGSPTSVDPRQFCNTNLKRNKNTPVAKARRKEQKEMEARIREAESCGADVPIIPPCDNKTTTKK